MYFCPTVQADSHDCARNLTSMEEIKHSFELNNVIALPLDDWIENPPRSFFQYRQWIFPSLQFSCDQNITRLIMRAERTNHTMNSPPLLSIWRPNEFSIFYVQIHLTNISVNDEFIQGRENIFYYDLDPPFAVMAGDFIGIDLVHSGRESHKIVFIDKEFEEVNASISYHRFFPSSSYDPLLVPPGLGSSTSRYVPLVTAQFGE